MTGTNFCGQTKTPVRSECVLARSDPAWGFFFIDFANSLMVTGFVNG
jgi:hypothetical protein